MDFMLKRRFHDVYIIVLKCMVFMTYIYIYIDITMFELYSGVLCFLLCVVVWKHFAVLYGLPSLACNRSQTLKPKGCQTHLDKLSMTLLVKSLTFKVKYMNLKVKSLPLKVKSLILKV